MASHRPSPATAIDSDVPTAGVGIALSDEEMWKRLRLAGLDEETIKRRDKAAFLAFVKNLQSQVDDYQHHLGLLILEKDEWMSKYEQLKTSSVSLEIAYKHEQAAHSSDLAEATKREQNLRKSLGIEKECVANIEKALHDMRVESAEIKVAFESKIADARKLMEVAQQKFDEAESKMLVAESLQAESNRKQNAAMRMMDDIENRENELQRRLDSFKSDYDNKENEIRIQRQELFDRQKLLDEQQRSYLEEKSLLNHRETHILEKTKELKHFEKELEEVKANIEEEHKILREKRSSFHQDMTELSIREEAIVVREAELHKKEQEFLMLQEKIACKEKEELQKTIAEHTRLLENKRCELESDIDEKRKCLDAEIQARTRACEVREADVCDRECALEERENALSLQLSLLAEKEDYLSNKASFLENKENDLCSTKRAAETELENLLKERECVLKLKLDLEKAKTSLEDEKEEIFFLRLGERNELLILEMKLAEEILSFRAHKMTLLADRDQLKAEREDLETKWELIDERRRELEKEAQLLNEEKNAMAEYLKNEQNSIKVEKEHLHNKYKNDVEAIYRQREEFLHELCNERLDLFREIQKEREDLLREIDIQRKELEESISKRMEETEMYLKDKEETFEKEKANELQQIKFQKEMIAKDLELVASEMQMLQKEKMETALSQEQMDTQWADIKSSIEALDKQREKLQKQRELLHDDREEIHKKIEHLKMLKAIVNDSEDKSLSRIKSNKLKVTSKRSQDNSIRKDIVCNVEHNLSPTSGSHSWIKRCTSLIFRFSSEKYSAAKSQKNFGAEVSSVFREGGSLGMTSEMNKTIIADEMVGAESLDSLHKIPNKQETVGLPANEYNTLNLDGLKTQNLSLSENSETVYKIDESGSSKNCNQLLESADGKSRTFANSVSSWFSFRKRSINMISRDHTELPLEPRQGQQKRSRYSRVFYAGMSSNCMLNTEKQVSHDNGLTISNLNGDDDQEFKGASEKTALLSQSKLAVLNSDILQNATSEKMLYALCSRNQEDAASLGTDSMFKKTEKVADEVLLLDEEQFLDMSESAAKLCVMESKTVEKNECEKDPVDESDEEEEEIQMSAKQKLWKFLIT